MAEVAPSGHHRHKYATRTSAAGSHLSVGAANCIANWPPKQDRYRREGERSCAAVRCVPSAPTTNLLMVAERERERELQIEPRRFDRE